MNAVLVFLVGCAILVVGYIFYGGWLAKQWGVDDSRVTPAHELEDGMDYVPAKAPVLMGHHFSSIAGAGPINGPIQAAVFGWVPVVLWVLIGGIFFGAVHDYGALFASIRHKGQSIGEVIALNIGSRAKKLFLIFSYLTLILVVAAFASIVASTFQATYVDGVVDTVKSATNASVAMISLLFILMAIIFGFFVYRKGASLAVATVAGVIGIVVCLVVGLILIGGIKRIGQVSEKLVPLMALLYVVLALGIIVARIQAVPAVFAAIFEGAFQPSAVTGGIVGSFFLSMKKGVSRGIFSNEAGLGTGSIAHACADTRKPVKQGMFGIFEVFMDTIVICTMTALVILLSGVAVPYGQAAGAELTISGFVAVYGSWVSIFTAIAMCCFAFSTIIGWGLYGARCAEFLFGSKIILPFNIAYALISIVGATVNLGLVWDVSDTFNGFMIVPNLVAVFLLAPTVLKLLKEYFEKEKI